MSNVEKFLLLFAVILVIWLGSAALSVLIVDLLLPR